MLRVDTIAFLDVPVNVTLSGCGQEGASVEAGDTIAFLYGNAR